MLKLYSFYWDCGRQGSVEGLFIAHEADVEEAIGNEIYFGEILGKHSEVYGTFDECDLKVLSEDQEKINWLLEIIGSGSISGYNPMEYVNQDDEDEEDYDEDGDE